MIRNKIAINFFLIIWLALATPLHSQAQYHTDSRRAVKQFTQALDYFGKHQNDEAMEEVEKALKHDEDFIEAYMLKAQILKDQGELEKAVDNFEKALSIDPGFYPPGYMVLSGVLHNLGRYREALEHLNIFMEMGDYAQISRDEAELFREQLMFALAAVQNPVPFEPENLGDSINSARHEYWPSLSLDEQKLVFTVLVPVPKSGTFLSGGMQEDFFISEKNAEGLWRKAKNAGQPLNSPKNEGAQTITADGKFLYFTACNRSDGYGQCDLYFSKIENEEWTTPMNIGRVINSTYSEKHPSVSPDGRYLYFASDRPGGFGGLDIWISKRTPKNTWSTPVNAGDSINTPLDEQSPFIHPDNNTLYFTSQGHQNLGKGDIFYSRRNADGNWGKAINIGYPINTHNNENGLIVNAKGDKAFFATDRIKGKGLDIYRFNLYEEARPAPVSYMKGRVFDAENMKGIAAEFEMIDLHSEEVIIQSLSDAKGEFLIPLPSGRNYAMNVSHPGYLFYSDHFAFKGIHRSIDPYLKDVPLQPVKEGNNIVLRNIFFEFDSAELLKESIVELNRTVDFLQNNPGIHVEISGHTDSIGSGSYNQELSAERAKSVVQYLVSKGIHEERLRSRGYGSVKPVATNETEEGRALNRRTEMTIIEKE